MSSLVKFVEFSRVLIEVVIYKAFCLDVAQGHMNGAPKDVLIEVPVIMICQYNKQLFFLSFFLFF